MPMLRTLTIENYKTISQLTLELGRVNLFIGANGSGKSNILEAITFGSAAAAGKLDNEFLANRGIRVTDPALMRCGFDKANLDRPIRLAFTADNSVPYDIQLTSGGTPYAGWRHVSIAPPTSPDDVTAAVAFVSAFDFEEARKWAERVRAALPATASARDISTITTALDTMLALSNTVHDTLQAKQLLEHFLAYAPQLSILRQLQLDSHIEPLGLHGEGLFRLLQSLETEGVLDDVNRAIDAIDWFDGLTLVGDGSGAGNVGRRIRITDRYLDPDVSGLDHLSANEGFLFFLFYVALLVSPHTPPLFAVENVDDSLNPRLCVHLMQTITRLSAAHDKQVILTTHNPAALDGLDLEDDDQRLFVIYRNADGHTRARRVPAPATGEDVQPVRLSEAFIRGYLGGLPTNF